MLRLVVWIVIGLAAIGYAGHYEAGTASTQRRDMYLRQFDDDDSVAEGIRLDYNRRYVYYAVGSLCWMGLGGLFFANEIRAFARRTTN